MKDNCNSPQFKLSGSHRITSASCKQGETLLCLVSERLGEMLLNVAQKVEAKGSY